MFLEKIKKYIKLKEELEEKFETSNFNIIAEKWEKIPPYNKFCMGGIKIGGVLYKGLWVDWANAKKIEGKIFAISSNEDHACFDVCLILDPELEEGKG